jgi:hypothetical protein
VTTHAAVLGCNGWGELRQSDIANISNLVAQALSSKVNT